MKYKGQRSLQARAHALSSTRPSPRGGKILHTDLVLIPPIHVISWRPGATEELVLEGLAWLQWGTVQRSSRGCQNHLVPVPALLCGFSRTLMIFVYSTATFPGPAVGVRVKRRGALSREVRATSKEMWEVRGLGGAESSCLGKERKGKLQWNH